MVGSTKDDHDVLGAVITIMLSAPLVLVRGVTSGYPLLTSKHPFVDDAIFCEVGHRKAMVLAWTVRDQIKLVLIALLLLVADISAFARAILFRYPGKLGPVREDPSGLAEPPGLNHCGVPEPVRESKT